MCHPWLLGPPSPNNINQPAPTPRGWGLHVPPVVVGPTLPPTTTTGSQNLTSKGGVRFWGLEPGWCPLGAALAALPACLCLPTCLPASSLSCLACLPASSLSCLACLPAFSLACLPASSLVCLLASSLACLLAYWLLLFALQIYKIPS